MNDAARSQGIKFSWFIFYLYENCVSLTLVCVHKFLSAHAKEKLKCKEIDFILLLIQLPFYHIKAIVCSRFLFSLEINARDDMMEWSMERLNGKYVCIMLRKYLNDCSSCIAHIRESINLFHHAYAHHAVRK